MSTISTRPIVGLLTDFGLVDDAVGICKGMLLDIAPNIDIVDVTHNVTPFDVEEASLYIRDSFRYFPTGSIFACVTFPHTGVQDDSIGLRTDSGHIYFAPNNGLLTRVAQEAGVAESYRVTSTAVRRAFIDPTFFGRDIVMSAAAHVARGVPLNEVGPAIEPSDITLLSVPEPQMKGDEILGEVAIVDKNFGNVWTTITHEFLIEHGIDFGTNLEIEIGSVRLNGTLRHTFGEVGVGEQVAYIASRGQLGVAINQGNFAATHETHRGSQVVLRKV